ncbi:prolyl oligopeptidase family serine peptidase [Ulvibacterium sp.]|uniref:prolyl oligopeptidase family serine peptidase n=1 Tax=Ulvibacterium sp. TaxID=2665914 RepID=UPI003BA9392B
MHKNFNYCSLYLFFICVGCHDFNERIDYPKIKNVEKKENHFGISYVNKFDNLENINTKEALDWYHAQDSLAESYFYESQAFGQTYELYENLENRESNSASSVAYNESGLTFYLSSFDGGNVRALFKKLNNNSSGEKLFNPKSYGDGAYDIEYFKASYDGNYVAIAMGKPENFFNEIILLDCQKKEIIGTPILNAKPNKAGGIVWSPDNKCIIYIAYPNTGENKNDRNSFTAMYCVDNIDEAPISILKNGINGIVLNDEYYPVPKFSSEKSNYIFVYLGNASNHWDCYYLPSEKFLNGNYDWKLLFTENDKVLFDYGMERNHIYYYKRINGDNIELCAMNLQTPDFNNPRILAKGKGSDQIDDFIVLRDNIFYSISSNGISETLYKYVENKEPIKIKLPFEAGNISFDFRSPYENDLWVKLSGWTSNPRDYYLDQNGKFEFVELGMWPDYPEFGNIMSEVVEVISHDGIKIPLSIVRRKDHRFNAESMGIITAYGAYGMSETPWFHSPIANFVNKGNIYATAHVRGGGEKGPSWHNAGMKTTKKNSWKDLIACSEYLIEKGYVNKNKLGLNVNSAGGITGAMAINERPDLYGVFTAVAPSLNPIRTEYFEDFDDSDNIFEFGTIKELQSYKDLLKMDPVLNLSDENDYPSTLLIIGFNDYLIPPSDSGKYIALLQSFRTKGDKPYLLDIDFSREHEINWLDDYAKMLYFTQKELE